MQQSRTYKLDHAVMIAWKNECYRSMATARVLGGDLYLIKNSKSYKGWKSIANYPKRMWKTIKTLISVRPKVIICLNQPPVLPFLCWLYAVIFKGKVIMDFHSGALTKAQWKPFIPFLKYMARTSPFTICHNRSDGQVLSNWGARVMHLLTLPQDRFVGHVRSIKKGRPLFLFACSFAEDEPVDMAIDAMRQCEDYDFVISGNYRKRGLIPSELPSHIQLAGFMAYEDYIRTMSEAYAVITLSDRPHIMQMAVHEAITLGTPVVTNKSPALEEVLGEGGMYCDLDAASLSTCIHLAVSQIEYRSVEIGKAKERAFEAVDRELEAMNAASPMIFQTTNARLD